MELRSGSVELQGAARDIADQQRQQQQQPQQIECHAPPQVEQVPENSEGAGGIAQQRCNLVYPLVRRELRRRNSRLLALERRHHALANSTPITSNHRSSGAAADR